MPNLDNIFNKFFPQSQTGSKGKFLIRMAWAIEIMVAVIGVCIGLIMIFGSKKAKQYFLIIGCSLVLFMN